MGFNIFHNLKIVASTEEVFKAVSQPKHLDNWWTLKSSGAPKLGAEYNLNFTDDYNWYCKVCKVQPDVSIHFKMTQSDNDWDPTTFGFDLKPLNGETWVEFSHVNWPEQNQHFKHSSFCWALLLNALKNYLENGIIIPFNKRS